MYLTTVVPVGHCILRSERCLFSFPASDAFFARPGNILNVGTAIKATVYWKYLKTVYLSYFLDLGLSVSNAGHLLKMLFHKFEF